MPHAIDVRVDVDPVQWFLNDADDTRSSYYLEDAATEFQVQGLELDWTCVTLGCRSTVWRQVLELPLVSRQQVDERQCADGANICSMHTESFLLARGRGW